MAVEQNRFTGVWADRIENLFEAGIDFADKDILDVGCNMGVLAYEVAKKRPSSYHGVDILEGHIDVAKAIFMGVPVPSIFNVLDIASTADRSKVFKHSYDVVLYLAVHQHIRRHASADIARDLALELFAHTKHALIFRGPDIDLVKDIAQESGFIIHTEFPRGRLNALCSFVRADI